MRQLLIAFFCLFLIHCTQEPVYEHIQVIDEIPQHIREVDNLSIFPGDSEPRYSIELIPEQTYGETGEPYLTTLYDAVVDDHGRVIILNSNTNTNYEHSIYVYDENGAFHSQLGRHGRGPGEYGFVIDLQFKAGKVFARDMTNERINIYNTEGYDFDRTMPIEQLAIRDQEEVKGMEFGLTFSRNDGNHLVGFYSRGGIETEYKYLLMNEDGYPQDYNTLSLSNSVSVKASDKSMSPSLGLGHIMGTNLETQSHEDELYSIFTRDFLIKRFDKHGIYKSAIYYPVQGLPLDLEWYNVETPFGYTAADVKKAVANSDLDLPETLPVLTALMVDDENRIWAGVRMDSIRDMIEWWILDANGVLLAKLQRPRKKEIFDIKDEYLYAKEIDEETDAEFIVKYRIEFSEK